HRPSLRDAGHDPLRYRRDHARLVRALQHPRRGRGTRPCARQGQGDLRLMSELRELYQQTILDHHQKPRNFRKLARPTASAAGYNPLCGDRVSVEVQAEDGVIRDVAWEGSGCAISRASASMMTASLKGQTITAAEQTFDRFHRMLT